MPGLDLTPVQGRPTFGYPVNRGRLVLKPGVTQELRSRVNAHIAAENRQRRLMMSGVIVAIVALCAYFVLRWLT